MPRSVSWRKLVQRFRRLGFDGPFSGGRHLFMVKGELKVRIPNLHRGDIFSYLLAEILRPVGMSFAKWESV